MRLILAILLFCAVAATAQTNRPLAAVNTVADLIARKPVTNERVLVAGWRTPGDWGAQRIMRHDPSSVLATNLGCVFDNAGDGRYLAEDCGDGKVDARWFGAKGDGVADDSVALQDALDHGGVIVLRSGPYYIGTAAGNAAFTNGAASVTPGLLVGPNTTVEGNNATILFDDGSASATDQFTVFSVDMSVQPTNIWFKNLTFDFRGTFGNYGSAIIIESPYGATNAWGKNLRFSGITAKNVRAGIVVRPSDLGDTYPFESVHFSDIMIEDTTSTGVTMCGIDGGSLTKLTVLSSEYDGFNVFGVRNFSFSDIVGRDIAEGFPMMSSSIRRNENLSFNNISVDGRGAVTQMDFSSGSDAGSDGSLTNVAIANVTARNASLNVIARSWPVSSVTMSGVFVSTGSGSAKRGIYAFGVTNLSIANPEIHVEGNALALIRNKRVNIVGGSLRSNGSVTNNYGTNVVAFDRTTDTSIAGTSIEGAVNGVFIDGALGTLGGLTMTGIRFVDQSGYAITGDGTVSTSHRLTCANCEFNGEQIDYEVVRNSYIPLLSGMGPKLDLTGTTNITVTHEFHDIGGAASNTLIQIDGGRLGAVVTLMGVNSEAVYIPGSASAGNIRNFGLGGAVLDSARSLIRYRYDGTIWVAESDVSYKGLTANGGNEYTISGNALTAPIGYVRVVPEGGAPDLLDNIYGLATLTDNDRGKLMFLQLGNSAGANSVTVRHFGGGGNIRTLGGGSVILSNVNSLIVLMWDGARWVEVADPRLGTLASLTGGNSSNFYRGDGAFNQVTTNDVPNLVTMLGGLQPLDAELTTVANLTGGNGSNFLRGDGSFAQVTTNDVQGLVSVLADISPTGAAYDLLYGTNVWRQYVVGTTTLGGVEMPIFEWIKTTNTVGAYYFDLAYLGNIWRTQITNVVVVGGIEMPVLEVKKL